MIFKYLALISVLVSTLSCKKKDDSKDSPSGELPLVEENADHGIALRTRSVAEVNHILYSRVVSQENFDIIDKLVDVPFDDLSGAFSNSVRNEIALLMGSYRGSGLTIATESMSPNPLYTLLWALAFSDFSDRVGKFCAPEGSDLKFHLAVEPLLRQACDQSPLSEQTVRELWAAFIAKDGTEEEFQAWYADEFVAAKDLPSEKRLAHLVKTMLFSAEFLIGR